MSKDIEFPVGMFVKKRDNAPDFVICDISFKMDDFIEWMSKNINSEGYVNVDILKAKSGNIYAKKNTFTPKPQTEDKHKPAVPENIGMAFSSTEVQEALDGIPF